MIKFELIADKDKMIFEGPYMIGSRPIIVKEWTSDFSFEKEVLREVPLWVRLPKLPLTCWSGDSLSRIGSVIGKPVCADKCTSKQQRISYARLLIEVDITKPLVYKVQIEGEKGMVMEHQVYYEWAPMFCQKCHKIGHICKEKKPKVPQKQWQQKDKGKGVMVENAKENEGWNKPKQTVAVYIQVGHIQVPTRNIFQKLGEESNSTESQGRGPYPRCWDMRLMLWNVRGCNRPFKQKEIKLSLLSNKVDVAVLLKTKVKKRKGSKNSGKDV